MGTQWLPLYSLSSPCVGLVRTSWHTYLFLLTVTWGTHLMKEELWVVNSANSWRISEAKSWGWDLFFSFVLSNTGRTKISWRSDCEVKRKQNGKIWKFFAYHIENNEELWTEENIKDVARQPWFKEIMAWLTDTNEYLSTTFLASVVPVIASGEARVSHCSGDLQVSGVTIIDAREQRIDKKETSFLKPKIQWICIRCLCYFLLSFLR